MSTEDRLQQWAPSATTSPIDGISLALGLGSLKAGGKNRCLVDPRAIVDKERKTAHMVAAARYKDVIIHKHL